MTRDRARDEIDPAAEPAYRRRNKAVAVSRRHSGSRLRQVLGWSAKAIVVIVPVGVAIALLAGYALNSQHFALTGADSVVLAGNHYVTAAEVYNALGAGAEPNLFRLSLNDARRQVENIPWVRSASLRRVYPDRLEVDVIERTPVAFVNVGGGLKLIDRDGVILEKPVEGSFDFPVLSGIASSMSLADRKARLALFEHFAQELKSRPGGAGWLVSEVDLSDDADLKALLVQGHKTILVHFGDKDFGDRFGTFLALLPQVEKAAPSVDSVDLRYRGQVVVNPRAPAGRQEAAKRTAR